MAATNPYSGPDSDLNPSPDDIMQFVSWWFQSCTAGQVEIGWLDAGGRGLIHHERYDLGDETLVYKVCAVNKIPGQSVYIRASTVSTPAGMHTTDEHFVQAPGVWGDIDTPAQMESAKNVQTIIRPNATVITGRVPNLRAQMFFRADAPLTSAALVRELNSGIVALYGGDPAVVNPSRYMRLPGTIAWPWKKNRTTAELTGLKVYTQAEGRTIAYPVAMLVSQLPKVRPTPAPAPQDPAAQPLGGAAGGRVLFGVKQPEPSVGRISGLIDAIRANREWHNSMVKLTGAWIARGFSDHEMLATAAHLTLDGYTVADTRAEMQKAIDGGRKKWGVPSEDKPVGVSSPAEPFSTDIIDPWDTLSGSLQFPLHVLPPVLRAYVLDRAEVMGADAGALAWACLSACSAAIDGNMRIKMKRWDNWHVPPSVWVALVGHSSSKKTPIFQAAWQYLEKRQSLLLKAHAEETKVWLKGDKKEENKPQPPTRYVTHDATMEKVQEILSGQSRGIGMLRDELAGFVGSLEKYSGGKGSSADRAFFLQSYNGGAHVVDRVGRGTTFVENLLVTICGGIQPDRLSQFGNLTDDGLWQRFIPIITESGGMGVDRPATEATRHYELLIDSLIDHPIQMTAEFGVGAHEIREDLERELHHLEMLAPMGIRFASFTGKLIGVFGRLSVVLSHIAGGISPHIVGRDVALAAKTLILQSIIPHAARVYMAMGDGAASLEATQSIAGFVLAKGKERLTAGALARDVRVCRGLRVQEVQAMVSPLVAGGWLVPEEPHAGNTAWIVNPQVHSRFQNRVALEEQRRRARRDILLAGSDEEGES